MKTHVFRGARYRIVESNRIKRDGYCDWRHKRDKRLWVKKSLSDKKRMEVLVHEALHACLPDADEHAVEETARDIALFLWRDGWARRK